MAKRKDGKFVAVTIPVSIDSATGKSFIAGMQNGTKLSRQNSVTVYDFNTTPVTNFKEEFCDYPLSDKKKPRSCGGATGILFTIFEGHEFTLACKIISQDLKPWNILLKNGVLKTMYGGLSRIISEPTTTTAVTFTSSSAAPGVTVMSAGKKREERNYWNDITIKRKFCRIFNSMRRLWEYRR